MSETPRPASVAAVRILVFALTFRGRGIDVAPGRRRARTTASGQLLRTVLAPAGVEGSVEPLEGDTASLEAEVELMDDGTFLEAGRIRYGAAGGVTFRTVGRGIRGPSGIPGRVAGAVIWEVTGGDGAFAGATGFITSNFSVDGTGEVVDHHVAQLVLP
jgi:hypothetical protein